MFDRPHHQRIRRLLTAFDGDLLKRVKCYFGFGTVMALALVEHRESVDLDFLYADRDGYHLLYSTVTPPA